MEVNLNHQPASLQNCVKYLILGAGPTGLGAGYRLQELGEEDFLIVESDSQVGGLSRSFVDLHGFLWDIGGHVQFSHYQYFDDVMDRCFGSPEGWIWHQRSCHLWMRDKLIPYPLQYNIRHLPQDELWKAVEGLLETSKKQDQPLPKDFRQWILQSFGEGLAESFFFPYNFKVWAFPPEMLSSQWVGDRVAQPDLHRVLHNIICKKDDISWGPNNKFRYPLHGGTGAIWKAVAKFIGPGKVATGTRIGSIIPQERKAILTDGREILYEKLLSTAPLDRLCVMLGTSGASLRPQVSELLYSSTHVVGFGFLGEIPEILRSKCWIYFPEASAPFYRLTVLSNYSPYNVPDFKQNWSIMLEISESPLKQVDENTLKTISLKALMELGWIPNDTKVVSSWHFRTEYGYPTPSVGRDAVIASTLPELESQSIYSRGRFGAWKYEISNQDHSFMQGVEWANSMTSRQAERTFRGGVQAGDYVTLAGE